MALVVGLEQFVPQLSSQDTKKRLQLGATLLSYLDDPLNLVDCTEMGAVIDGLVAWLNSSNSKVAQNGLEILSILAERLKEDFRPYISTVIPATMDRMGDSKDSVREQAKYFTMTLMKVSSPQYILEKMMPAFSHKNFRIREEVLLCLQDTLNAYGPQNLSLMKFMPLIAKLLGDPNSQVRETAFQTFVIIYTHVGERVRMDLGKKYGIPPAKLQALFDKFDEVKRSGQLLHTATLDLAHRGDDELDRAVSLGKASKRASSAPPNRRAVLATPIKPAQQPSTATTPATLTRKHSLKGAPPVKAAVSANAGAVDEEMFIRSFEDVPKTQLYSAKELEQELAKIKQVLNDTNADWEKRVDMLRHLRSLLLAGAADYEELFASLRLLEPSFQVLVRDLRSQVVREACITIAYLSQQLGHKLDHFSEAVLPALINLIPNSAKIMSTSGIVTVRFIIQHTHVSRLIPVITMNLSSKSKDIRRSCFEFLDQLLHTWPTHTLERHIAILQEAIRKGISDADPEARAFSRKAFWGFADHFKEQADVLLNSLDSGKQRMLQGELCMSNSSSSNSLNSAQGRPLKHSVSSHGSMENLRPGSGSATLGRTRSGVPVYNNTRSASVRSNSAIDLGAARRARARAFTTAQNRGTGASLPRPGTKRADTVSSTMASPERISRSRTKGVSQSQPSSRSGSPTSRLSYATYSHTDGTGRVRRKSGIPTPVGTSREASPTRPTAATPSTTGIYERRLSGSTRRPFGGACDRYNPQTTITTPLMAQQILQQSKEAEAAVADALECWNTPPRKNRYNAFDDQSDESETSSVCSDRSFSSYNRGGYEGHIPVQDVPTILKHLSSIHWSDRKEGLLGLLSVLRSGRTLSLPDLKKVTEMFTKMFMDPHTKVFTLFLEALGELIHVHSGDLHSWLYVLLTRLFIKTGTDLLSSLQMKIQKILSIIRDCFPHGDQFQAVVRYITDPTQTPNIKVKITILRYLMTLLHAMDSGDLLVNTPETHSMVAKIFAWIRDQKSPELKRHAQEVIVSIFKLRPGEINGLLSRLDPDNQALAMGLIQSYMRGRSDDSELRTPSPITTHVPISSTPNRGSRSRSSTPLQRSLEDEEDNTENLNPDELYSSLLRRTTAQIHRLALDPVRGTDSTDSTLTPTSRGAELLLPPLGGGSFRQRLAPQNWEESCTFTQQRLTGSREASPVKRMASWDYDGETGMHRIRRTSLDGGVAKSEQDTLNNIFAILQNPNSRTEHRKQALSELVPLTKDGSPELWDENFRNVLRCLVENLEEQVVPVKVAALRALAELLKRQPQHFHNYAELTLIKIFGTFKQSEREDSELSLTNEELEKRIEKLSKQQAQFQNKVAKASSSIRAVMLGQDRFRRRYWLLPIAGGIFVEAMESCEQDGMGDFVASDYMADEDDSSSEDSSVAKEGTSARGVKEERQDEEERPALSSVKQEPCDPKEETEDDIPQLAASTTGEVKDEVEMAEKTDSPNNTEEPEKKQKETEAPLSTNEKGPSVATKEASSVASVPTSAANLSAVTTSATSVSVTKEKSPLPEPTLEQSWMMHSPFFASIIAGNMLFNSSTFPTPGAAPSSSSPSSSPQVGAASTVALGKDGASPLFGGFTTPLSAEHMLKNLAQKKPWFSLLPRVPCDEESLARLPGSKDMDDDDIEEEASSTVGSTMGSSRVVSVIETEDTTNQYDKPQPVPPEYLRGWWRITDSAQLRTLMGALHSNGIREKALLKQLEKNFNYGTVTCIPNSQQDVGLEITDLDRDVSEKHGGAPPPDYEDQWSPDVALRVDLAILAQVEALEQRLFGACMEVKHWRPPPKVSDDQSIQYRPSCVLLNKKLLATSDDDDEEESSASQTSGALSPDHDKDKTEDDTEGGDATEEANGSQADANITIEDAGAKLPSSLDHQDDAAARSPVANDGSKQPSSTPEDNYVNPVQVAKERLLGVEAGIERRYLRPPLGTSGSSLPQIANASSGGGSSGNKAEEEGAGKGPGEEDEEPVLPPGLVRWREAVAACQTAAQLAMCFSQLEACIAWDRSFMKASCQFCHSGDNEQMLLLCDGCDKGYHTYCFKPKMDKIPDGDWYCYECLNKTQDEKVCILCGKKGKLVRCDACPKVFHHTCLDPPLSKPPKGKWCCSGCSKGRKKGRPSKGHHDSTKESSSPSKKAAESSSSMAAGGSSSASPGQTTKSSKSGERREKNKAQVLKDLAACRQILEELEQHKDAWPFLVPVNTKQFPSYRKFIKKPMDVSTIRSKLESNQYKCKDEFALDVRLIFDNCETFNEDDSPVGQAGHNMRNFFESRWVELTS